MTEPSDLNETPMPFDSDIDDLVLASGRAPDDVPHEHEAVLGLLEALRAQPTAEELAREAETVTAMMRRLRSSSRHTPTTPRRIRMFPVRSRAKAAVALVAAALATTTGVAFAGELPGPAQGVASSVLAPLGVSVPAGTEDLPDEAQAGQAKAAGNQAAAEAYAEAVQDWADCVGEAASGQGHEETRKENFDPTTVCGPHPSPAGFGLGGPEEGARQGEDLPDEAQAGQAIAAEKQAAATAYAEAVQDWADCVGEAASGQGDEEMRQENFDPETVCGPHPSPPAVLTGPENEATEDSQKLPTPERGGGPEERKGGPSDPGEGNEPRGRAEGGGRSEDRDGPADRAAPSEDGRPADAGPPANVGPSANPDSPSEPGPPQDASPPQNAGPPEDTEAQRPQER